MNLSKSAFRRYKVIDGILRNSMHRYPTMADIIRICKDKLDFEPSAETIQKDIANMRMPYPDGFDAPISFCRRNLGYRYDDPNYSLSGVSLRQEELDAIEEAVEMIRSIGGSRISHKFSNAVEKLLSATIENKPLEGKRRPILQTMNPPVSRGFENFDLFYRSAKEHFPVSLIHYSYKKRKFGHTILHPFLIKEFDNRWYVIGYSESHESIRTFGLDRISQPFVLKKKFHPIDSEQQITYLNDVYGVFPIPDAKKEQVKIRVSQLSTHYFQAYPLHESQVIKKESDGASFITFELVPSIELARYFLSQGRHVSIVSPEWFKKFTQDLAE
jgi:predicted DNA-binding transcriptional regulator YafY